jgi:hypothetical protein
MQLSPPFRHSIPLWSKYSPQHPVLKHPQFMFLPYCQRPCSNPQPSGYKLGYVFGKKLLTISTGLRPVLIESCRGFPLCLQLRLGQYLEMNRNSLLPNTYTPFASIFQICIHLIILTAEKKENAPILHGHPLIQQLLAITVDSTP